MPSVEITGHHTASEDRDKDIQLCEIQGNIVILGDGVQGERRYSLFYSLSYLSAF